jgi:hypothetical protein
MFERKVDPPQARTRSRELSIRLVYHRGDPCDGQPRNKSCAAGGAYFIDFGRFFHTGHVRSSTAFISSRSLPLVFTTFPRCLRIELWQFTVGGCGY